MSTSTSTNSAGQVVSLHVYRVGRFFGDDKIVKAQDKVTDRYYMKVDRGDTHWHFTLHAGGPDGEVIYRVSSGYTGPPLMYDFVPVPILVNITSERHPIYVERRQGAPQSTQWFRGTDNREYHWQSSAQIWRNNMQCLDAKGEIVATYRTTTMAMWKDGELCIYPLGQSMIDLLVVTCLAIRMPSH